MSNGGGQVWKWGGHGEVRGWRTGRGEMDVKCGCWLSHDRGGAMAKVVGEGTTSCPLPSHRPSTTPVGPGSAIIWGPCPHACRSPGPTGAWMIPGPGHSPHHALSQPRSPHLGPAGGGSGRSLGDERRVSPDSALMGKVTLDKTSPRLPTGQGLQLREQRGPAQVTPVRSLPPREAPRASALPAGPR